MGTYIDQRRRREVEGQIHPSIKEKIEKAYMFVSSLTIGIGGTPGTKGGRTALPP